MQIPLNSLALRTRCVLALASTVVALAFTGCAVAPVPDSSANVPSGTILSVDPTDPAVLVGFAPTWCLSSAWLYCPNAIPYSTFYVAPRFYRRSGSGRGPFHGHHRGGRHR